jgi:nifR3 family TIM-barrel protein
MTKGFWDQLAKPIMALAPMANVTDAAFRSVIAKYGKPDVMWTEFVSVDGLLSPGREKLPPDFWYAEAQRPIVAQIFGSRPEHFERVASLLAELKFDGIDINMGCPVRKVINQQSCSALIRTPQLAQEIIAATKQGARGLPVSVKTRLGFSKVEIDSWIPQLLVAQPAALTVHLRTVKELSKVPAHWELMPETVKLVKALPEGDRPILLGNGDIQTLAEADQKIRETGIDGVMIGRGIFGNPWTFNRAHPLESISIPQRLSAMVEHTKLFEEQFKNVKSKNFETMKKHYKAYVNNFDGAKELRQRLMDEANTAADVTRIVNDFLKS